MSFSAEKINKDDMNQILDRTTSWIENCDTKASVVLGGLGVAFSIMLATDFIGYVTNVFKGILENINFFSVAFIIIAVLSLGAIIFGCFFLVLVVVPKTNPQIFKSKDVVSDSLIFFSSIGKNKSVEQYKEKLIAYSEKDLIDDICSQIYICSLICTQKFRNYKIGLLCTVFGFVVFAVLIIVGTFVAG